MIYEPKSNELESDATRTEEAFGKLGTVAPSHRELAVAVFDWSQQAPGAWQGSNTYVRRQILNAVYLNRTLTDVTLVTAKRRPFDSLAERLKIETSRKSCF